MVNGNLLMSGINKICFAYPVTYKDGMTNEESCIPSPLLRGAIRGDKNIVVVTIGMMIALNEEVSIRAYINPKGKLDENETLRYDGKFVHLQTHVLSLEQAIFLSSMYIEDVVFENSGEYEITAMLLKNENLDTENEVVIDELKSSFYVLIKEES